MHDVDEIMRERRAEIARRNRRRIAQDRDARLDRTLKWSIFGIAAGQGIENLWTSTILLVRGEGAVLDHAIAFALGAMFVFAAYRIWSRDDIRHWWLPALPSALTLLLALPALSAGHPPAYLWADVALLFLVFRRRDINAVTTDTGAPPRQRAAPPRPAADA